MDLSAAFCSLKGYLKPSQKCFTRTKLRHGQNLDRTKPKQSPNLDRTKPRQLGQSLNKRNLDRSNHRLDKDKTQTRSKLIQTQPGQVQNNNMDKT